MKKLWIGFCATFLVACSLVGADVSKHIRVDLSGQPDAMALDFMRLHPDVTSVDRGRGFVDVVATTVELEKIEQLGLRYEVLIEDVNAYMRNLALQGYYDHFHNYERMLAELQAVEAAHPDIVRLHDIGDGWDKIHGVADRDIWAVKISDNVEVEEPEEPEVLYIACHHAREIITPEIVLFFINYLVDNYGTDPEVTYLVNNRQMWLVPIMNPDGHAIVFTGTDWRKNVRDNNDNGQFDLNADGVDLNRNWGYMWGYDNYGSSPNPSSWTYRGPEPFSEPETQAVRDLALVHNFGISLSYHSYGNWWLYPWGYAPENPPDIETFVALADSCVAYNGYDPGNAASGTIYITNGDSDDWLYGERGIFAFTPEVGTSGFYPDTSEVMSLILENLGPNLYVAKAVGLYLSYSSLRYEEIEGDGDGILGPGETVDLYVRLHNSGLEGAAGTSAHLETDDPDITMIDSEAIYPEIAFGAVVENQGDPFSFSVGPDAVPHSIEFTLTLSGGDGVYPSQMTFRLLIGQGSVLLVADDGVLDNKNYYIEALNFLGIPYDLEDLRGTAKSASRDLLEYSEVVWFTGPVERNTLTAEDQSTLQAFLESGGRLLLSGNLIGFDIGQTSFYRDYLHAEYVSFMTLLHHLNATPYNPVDPNFHLTLASTGDNAQGFAGEADPISPAISILQYDRSTPEGPGIIKSSGSGALVVETDGYKVAYFSFGLEGVEPLQDRANLLADVLSWFKIQGGEGGDGDVDGNGTVNVLDVVIAINIILGTHQPTEGELERADMNGDGQINVVDIIQIVNVILGTSVAR
jgi:hypothetical protein